MNLFGSSVTSFSSHSSLKYFYFCFCHYGLVLVSIVAAISLLLLHLLLDIWAWNKDTVLLYSIQYWTVKYKKAQPLVEDTHTWQHTPDAWTNLCDWTCKSTFPSLKACNLKVCMQGTYYSWLVSDFPGGSGVKKSACSAGDDTLIPGSGRSPRKGNGNPLQYSCLGTPGTQESCRLQSMGSQRVRPNWTQLFTSFYIL